MVVHKTHYSLENFRGASGRGHHVLYKANDSRGKLLRLAKNPCKPQKFFPFVSYVCPENEWYLHACMCTCVT